MNVPPPDTNCNSDAPAPLRGVEGLTRRNEARLIWWAIRARLHGAGGWWFAVAAIATARFGAWIIRPLGAGAVVAAFVVVSVATIARELTVSRATVYRMLTD